VQLPEIHNHLLSRRKAGFSIIEVLFALVLLGLVLVGVAVLLTRSLVTAADARYRDIANGLAQEVIEIYHRERTLTSWSEFITAGAGSHCVLSDARRFADAGFTNTTCADSEGVTVSGILFQREVAAVLNSDKLETIVTVKWKSGRQGGTAEDEIIARQDFTNWL